MVNRHRRRTSRPARRKANKRLTIIVFGFLAAVWIAAHWHNMTGGFSHG